MQTPSDVPRELLEAYDQPLPRYTSYPTALQFDDAFDGDAAADLLEEDQTNDPVSLYVHIPFCEKLCWYCACNRVIEKDAEKADRYLDAVILEMKRKKDWIGDRPVVQIHFGGGTPTFLGPDQIRRIGDAIRDIFEVGDDAEFAVEIDPRACDRDRIEALADVGLTRASLGVQDHDPDVQEAIHRHQPYEITRETVEELRAVGTESINFDLIYGLPRQTVETFGQTLDDLLALSPGRAAVYSYAHVPWKNPAQKHLERIGLPDAETRLDILTHTIERLTDAGLAYIGMDHFAAPDDGLTEAFRSGTLRRNFQGYSTHKDTDIFAFGVSGISQTAGAYFQNYKSLDDYYDAIEDLERSLPVARGYSLSDDDLMRRRTIMALMCRPQVNFNAMSEELGVDFRDQFNREIDRLEPLEEDDLVRVTDDAIDILPRGRLFLRHIASLFDRYLDRDEDRYSSAV